MLVKPNRRMLTSRCGVSIALLPWTKAGHPPKLPPLSTTPDLIAAVEFPLPLSPPCLPLVPQTPTGAKPRIINSALCSVHR